MDKISGIPRIESVDAASKTCEQEYQHPIAVGLCYGKSTYKKIQTAGGWPKVSSGKTIEPGMQDSRITTLRERLSISGEYKGITKPLDPTLYDAELAEAVLLFQHNHGLTEDSIIGRSTIRELDVPVKQRISQIERSLRRFLEIEQDPNAKHLIVNIPAYKLYAFQDGNLAFDMKVIVGKGSKKIITESGSEDHVKGLFTPTFSGAIKFAVVNPYWNVPYSIIKDELIPDLSKKPQKMIEDGFELFEKESGAKLPIIGTNWPSIDPKIIKAHQLPGKANPLGRIKFIFPNKHNVYLHDTSSPQLFTRDRRNFSHGCVRISEPFALGAWLLSDQGINLEKIESLVQKTKQDGAPQQQYINLDNPVPVHIVYLTAWPSTNGQILFYKDVYKKDR